MIFLARIGDVSIGIVQTIVTVQGRSFVAFSPAIFELCSKNRGFDIGEFINHEDAIQWFYEDR